MTVPTNGSPDFQTAIPWKSGNLFTAATSTFAVGTTQLPILPSLAFSALQLRFIPSVSHGFIQVQWFADAGGVTQLGADTWDISTLLFVLVTLPTEAPFFALTVINNGTVPMVAQTWAMLSNVPVFRPTYPVVATEAFGNAVSLPPSGTSQDTPNFYSKGAGHLRLVPGDALGKINVTLDHVNNAHVTQSTLIRAAGFTAEVNFDFPYPDQPLFLNFTNTDAGAAHTITYHLWCADDV